MKPSPDKVKAIKECSPGTIPSSKARVVNHRRTSFQRTAYRTRKLGHNLWHLGKTKAQQLLREKYWFPLMNSMIDRAITQCYKCQVAKKEKREEPIKVTNIPSQPWWTRWPLQPCTYWQKNRIPSSRGSILDQFQSQQGETEAYNYSQPMELQRLYRVTMDHHLVQRFPRICSWWRIWRPQDYATPP